ncbi:MFS monocarboxylate transporter-like protein [Coleophoma crateriformis]|uniref:MFS monocarboxylate transporter-like protein n=1 Tax=Coleophoma crateriformis TaxID=565419 RepID=A0A3D8SY93_9HELO|nr:MFS monocarboxylate transporter-like protein [Coleophoma crateriformis]
MGNEAQELEPDRLSITTPQLEAQVPPPASDEIPNGGLTAWLQVLGSFILFFNTWGIVNTFGTFQTYYSLNLPQSNSDIAWIGSIAAFLLLLVGIGAGPLYDAGYFKQLLLFGSFFVVFGMMMTSIATQYWQIMLSQGICMGLGNGLLFVPSVAIVSQWFTTRKAFATGIAAAGSSLGGVIYPIIFHKLQPKIGFGWTTRVIAFIMLAMFCISSSVMRVRSQPKTARALLDLSAFHDSTFLLFSGAMFFGFVGLYTPFFYIQVYALDKGVDSNFAFYLLSLLNVGSIFGRIIPNRLADHIGPLNVIIPGTLITAILAFGWIGIISTPGLIIFTLLYGFFSGSYVSIPPTVLMVISPDLKVVGTRMGMCFAICGCGLLIGAPIAGLLITKYGFIAAISFSGAAVLAAFALLVGTRVSRVGWVVKSIE